MAGTLARARADQALRESQARLDLAAAAAGAGLWSLNLENQVFWVTEKTRQLFDFPPDEPVTFQRFLATVLPEDQERIRSTVKLLIEPGREAEVEYRIKRPDGSLRWILSRGRVHSNKSGGPDSLMGVSVDQTPRKTAELASQQAKTTLDAIIESTQDLIWSVDSECFGLMTFNGGLSRYFQEGRRIAIKPGMRPEDLFPPGEYVKRWRDMYRRALDHGPFVTEYVVFTGKRTLLLSFNLLRRDGKTFGVSVFGKDVTEQKTAQKEAHELRETLAHTGRVTVLGQLTSTLAHELSQPLGAILRNAESAELILQMASPDLEELRAIVTDIRVDDERAGSVINRLRSLLKRRSLDLQPVALPELVSEVLTLVQTDANLRHVKLHCSVQPGLPKVSGDRIHLQQVMLNLIINAMDALSEVEDRCVHVTVQATAEGMIQVLVADNGPGIAEGSAERVFEPFFTTKSSGMGLGLAVSKTLIEAHHGTIWCTNPPQGGACFGFALPLITKERAL